MVDIYDFIQHGDVEFEWMDYALSEAGANTIGVQALEPTNKGFTADQVKVGLYPIGLLIDLLEPAAANAVSKQVFTTCCLIRGNGTTPTTLATIDEGECLYRAELHTCSNSVDAGNLTTPKFREMPDWKLQIPGYEGVRALFHDRVDRYPRSGYNTHYHLAIKSTNAAAARGVKARILHMKLGESWRQKPIQDGPLASGFAPRLPLHMRAQQGRRRY